MGRLIVLSFVICHLSLPSGALIAAPKEHELPPLEGQGEIQPPKVILPFKEPRKMVEKLPAPEVATPEKVPKIQPKINLAAVISSFILLVIIMVLVVLWYFYPKKRQE